MQQGYAPRGRRVRGRAARLRASGQEGPRGVQQGYAPRGRRVCGQVSREDLLCSYLGIIIILRADSRRSARLPGVIPPCEACALISGDHTAC